MEKLFNLNCLECKRCCRFFIMLGKELTAKEIKKTFLFDDILCNTFFRRKNNKFLISKECQQLKNGKCQIYYKENFPSACAFFPFFLTHSNTMSINLTIDNSCPESQKLIKQYTGSKELKSKIIKLFYHFYNNDKMTLFKTADLRNCGYNIKVIERNFIQLDNIIT